MSQASPATIVWFRQDLRLADQPALLAAVRAGGPVIPVFIWTPQEVGGWAPGAASRWWLHHSLTGLSNGLKGKGSRLILRQGSALDVLRKLVAEVGARAVFWNRCYEPAAQSRDRIIEKELHSAGIEVRTFNSGLLRDPWDISTTEGKPYQVFTAFWRACCAAEVAMEATGVPAKIPGPSAWPSSVALSDLSLEPTINWAVGLSEAWSPGEAGAHAQLQRFVERALATYGERRNRPDLEGSSKLSPHLHFGEIGPRQVLHAVRAAQRGLEGAEADASVRVFLSELGWREFAHHLLHHFPHTVDQPLRENFRRFPWKNDASALQAWQRGQTGYPLVDAGMRELWATGWMHNRVRMVAASFLVKDLLIPWQRGAEWFWDTLVDADLANNTLGWQWTAGCGADAAPYFRIFNPVSQGQKFDPLGDYVRRWIPELRELPDRYIHAPWEASAAVLDAAGIRLGRDYPQPMVDHGEARDRALAAFELIKGRQ